MAKRTASNPSAVAELPQFMLPVEIFSLFFSLPSRYDSDAILLEDSDQVAFFKKEHAVAYKMNTSPQPASASRSGWARVRALAAGTCAECQCGQTLWRGACGQTLWAGWLGHQHAERNAAPIFTKFRISLLVLLIELLRTGWCGTHDGRQHTEAPVSYSGARCRHWASVAVVSPFQFSCKHVKNEVGGVGELVSRCADGGGAAGSRTEWARAGCSTVMFKCVRK